jgi:hypothetical protein
MFRPKKSLFLQLVALATIHFHVIVPSAFADTNDYGSEEYSQDPSSPVAPMIGTEHIRNQYDYMNEGASVINGWSEACASGDAQSCAQVQRVNQAYVSSGNVLGTLSGIDPSARAKAKKARYRPEENPEESREPASEGGEFDEAKLDCKTMGLICMVAVTGITQGGKLAGPTSARPNGAAPIAAPMSTNGK